MKRNCRPVNWVLKKREGGGLFKKSLTIYCELDRLCLPFAGDVLGHAGVVGLVAEAGSSDEEVAVAGHEDATSRAG